MQLTFPRRRRAVAIALAGSALLLAGAVSAATAPSTPLASAVRPFSYVALGDSFSAGEGIPPFLQSGPDCHRSSRAYSAFVQPPGYTRPLYAIASGRANSGAGGGANLYGSDTNVRSANRVMWESFACSGAKTTNVLPGRLGGVPQGSNGRYDGKTQIDSAALATANLVTLTLGGNDAGYVDVLITCGLGNCNSRAFERSREAVIDRTKPRLEKVYRAIAARAPRARILVLGYPNPFPAARAQQACPALSPFQGEQDMLRRLARRFNATVESTVARVARSGARITYVPMTGRFQGHEVCGSKGAWINGIVTSQTGFGLSAASFHPNLAGQHGYAAAVNAALRR